MALTRPRSLVASGVGGHADNPAHCGGERTPAPKMLPDLTPSPYMTKGLTDVAKESEMEPPLDDGVGGSSATSGSLRRGQAGSPAPQRANVSCFQLLSLRSSVQRLQDTKTPVTSSYRQSPPGACLAPRHQHLLPRALYSHPAEVNAASAEGLCDGTLSTFPLPPPTTPDSDFRPTKSTRQPAVSWKESGN